MKKKKLKNLKIDKSYFIKSAVFNDFYREVVNKLFIYLEPGIAVRLEILKQMGSDSVSSLNFRELSLQKRISKITTIKTSFHCKEITLPEISVVNV